MHTAWSAMRTCRAPASASEYTATVSIPRRRQVRMTRQAISPRLAIRRRLNNGLAGMAGPGGNRGAGHAVETRSVRGAGPGDGRAGARCSFLASDPGRRALAEERQQALLALGRDPQRGD